MSIFASMRYCLGPQHAHGNLYAALFLMPLGLFFDFMDGKVARWRKKSSLMGQELDSLADLVWIPISSIDIFLTIGRSPSAWLQQSPHLPLASAPRPTTYFSHFSCFVDLLVLLASTSRLQMFLKMPRERASTSKAHLSQPHCRLPS